MGKWLQKGGFNCGQNIRVLHQNRIVITNSERIYNFVIRIQESKSTSQTEYLTLACLFYHLLFQKKLFDLLLMI